MKLQLSKDATTVLEELYALVKETADGHMKLDMNEKDSGIMPVSIEIIRDFKNGRMLLSVAHYYEQEGDMMADPMMEFLRDNSPYLSKPVWYAVRYKMNGIFATDRDSLIINEVTGAPERYFKKSNYADRTFASTWMRNIAWQQQLKSFLKVKVK
ncbi:MAG: hypothetical protein ABJH04_08020 [Cyclobacteriaceae bacterium]